MREFRFVFYYNILHLGIDGGEMKKEIIGITTICILLAGAFFHIGGYNNLNGSGQYMPDVGQNVFIPIVAEFVMEPHTVLSSDGKYHRTYELQLTNANPLKWQINFLEVLNVEDHNEIFAEFSGDRVKPNNQIVPGRISSETLARSETSLFILLFL